MEDEYIGVIKIFAGNFEPKGWMFCDGRSLPIGQNQGLFALIGNIYGGDSNNFDLPDLRGRVVAGVGQGPDLSDRPLGQFGGNERVEMTVDEMPGHGHPAQTTLGQASVQTGVKGASTVNTPNTNVYPGIVTDANGDPLNIYSNTGTAVNSPITGDATTIVNNTGKGEPHQNMQPFICINYIICVIGLFPQRS